MKAWLLLLAIGVSVVLGTQAFLAEGAPSAPTLALQSGLTPGSSQTAFVVVSSQLYSVQPPNSIDQLGAKVVYSAWQNGIQVAFQQTQALGVTGGSGSLYGLTATLPITLQQVCSGSQCGGYTENLTVTSQVVVPTYDGVYTSKVVTVTFLSSGNTGASLLPTYGPQTQPPASIQQFEINFWGALTLILVIDLYIAAAMVKHWSFAFAGSGALVALVLEVLLWGL